MSTLASDTILARLTRGVTKAQSSEMVIRSAKKAILALITPAAVLLFVALTVQFIPFVHNAVLSLYKYVPYVICGAVLLLAWRFNRARAYFPALLLAVAYGVMQELVLVSTGATADAMFALLCLLVPANFLVYGLLVERGIFSRPGFIRFLAIVVQVAVSALLVVYAATPLGELLYTVVSTTTVLPWQQLPQLAQLVFVAAAAVLVVRVLVSHNAVEGGLVSSLVAFMLAMEHSRQSFVFITFFSVAGLLLIITVIQDSWRMAYVDELTGLPGRRALNEQLLKLGQVYTVVMVDVDHFKKFNDTHGHDVGDQVLRYVAARLERVGSGGKAYRYGGEEFTLLFPNRVYAECEEAIARVHRSIGESRFSLRSSGRPLTRPEKPKRGRKPAKDVKITVSAGVATCVNGDLTPRDALKKADKALYKAKDAGRNCIQN